MNPDLNQVRQSLRDGDSFATVELIQRGGAPPEIAARYQSLITDLYWKAHDLPCVVAIGRAGITYCLGQSVILGAPPDEVESFRSTAKAIAYDVGSFTWPGWEEPGIDPTPAEMEVGRDCAKLNLRLALELKKPPDRVSMAYWLLGAHALAVRDYDYAILDFQAALNVLLETEFAAGPMQLSNAAYLALAQFGKNPHHSSAAADFDHAMKRLHGRGDKDAKSYISQLNSARRLFVP
jgi:hypothetical protein